MVVNQPVENKENRDTEEEHEPEPEEEIDLLIDDVLSQDTHPVLDPFLSGGSNIRQVAGYFSGEGVAHWVAFPLALSLRQAEIVDNVPAVPAELPAEEPVGQIKLDDQQEEVEELT